MQDLLLDPHRGALSGAWRLLVGWLFFVAVIAMWIAAMFLAGHLWPGQRVLGNVTSFLALLLGYHLNWRLLGTERVELDGHTLRITQKAGIFGDSAAVQLSDVVAVHVRTCRGLGLLLNEIALRRARVVVQSADRRKYPCGLGLSDTDAHALVQGIRNLVEHERRRTRA